MDYTFSTGYRSSTEKAVTRNTTKAKNMTASAGAASPYFQQWAKEFKNLKFYKGEYAFGKTGIGSVTISATQLKELENDPAKRKEFENMLKTCDEIARQSTDAKDSRLKKQGFFLDKEGKLQGWTIANNYASQATKYIVELNMDTPNKWGLAMSSYKDTTNPNQSNWSSRFGK